MFKFVLIFIKNQAMKSEVIIDVQPKEISIALLEDQKLVEFQQEARTENFAVGNIYLAKVRKLMPGLNACFVNVGHEKDAFLHYLDLGSHYFALEKFTDIILAGKHKPLMSKIPAGLPILEKEGQIQNTLKQGQEILVQVVKEPINTKGPRLTSEISFAGRYLVLIPFANKINVSTKIKSDAERVRLKQIVNAVKPQNYGVIIRTVAEGKNNAEIENELRILIKRWEDTIELATKVKQRPACIFEETSRTVGMIRDLFNLSYENIIINDEQVYKEIKDYVGLIAPESINIVKLYNGAVPIFDNYSVTKQIKASLGRVITYKHGAYMIIEQTEALHVIDVNSGNRSKSPDGQEANALDVNLGAADEIARQLRLRDIGGIIVIDFIDMSLAENRQKLYERMCQNMQSDRAKHNILPLSKFGLMQITRQRVRPAMNVSVEEECPTCGGTGKIKSSLLFVDMIEHKIEIMSKYMKGKKFYLHLHPFVESYINKGVFSRKLLWKFKYGFSLNIIPNQKLSFLEYKFYDNKQSEINLKEENEMN